MKRYSAAKHKTSDFNQQPDTIYDTIQKALQYPYPLTSQNHYYSGVFYVTLSKKWTSIGINDPKLAHFANGPYNGSAISPILSMISSLIVARGFN